MKKLSKKIKKEKGDGIPIRYMLNIPIVKVDLYDDEGKKIENIQSVQTFREGIMVLANGNFYTNVDFNEKLKNI